MSNNIEEIEEIHGMRVRDINSAGALGEANLSVRERTRDIFLPGHSNARLLTPAQARYLAQRLDHLADRIDKRLAKSE